MSSRSLIAYAPSNIAWIKYMGKLAPERGRNLPENPSLSMTLDRLRTWVEIRPSTGPSRWIAESPHPEAAPPVLSASGQDRILSHAERVAQSLASKLPHWRFEFPARIELRTANTFPAGAGIASSASSFAAVALAVAAWHCSEPARFRDALEKKDPELLRALSELAREGSGSASRSIEGPFTIWEGTHARAIPSNLGALSHFVILLSKREKEVSSSEAHARVRSSPRWAQRAQKAEGRIGPLREAILAGDFATCARLAWKESCDMHELFHTATPPFSYQTEETQAALRELEREIPKVLVTMDAGPNIHVCVPAPGAASLREKLRSRFGSEKVLEDSPGPGAGVVRWS